MTNMGEKMTEDEVKEIIGEADLDGGVIKIEEFAKMMMQRIWTSFLLLTIFNK